MSPINAQFVTYDTSAIDIIGNKPTARLCLENSSYPWAHEACVYIPSSSDLFITSNRITAQEDGKQKIIISKVNIRNEPFTCEEITADIPMANGGVNYLQGVLFCAQGTVDQSSGLVYMDATTPYRTVPILESFNGRQFNSPNDVVVHRDGSIWFTDPVYGFEQGFRPPPQLPNQVYRYDPTTKGIRAMADGFGRPNGISFSPDQTVVYISDTDCIHGDGTRDYTRASSIYAFDIMNSHGQPFLVNRRLFALADGLIPDGIKCDSLGNVYSGCADGIAIWSPGGVLLGKILLPGGVSNFCFCREGELIALNETRLWQVRLHPRCTGALLML